MFIDGGLTASSSVMPDRYFLSAVFSSLVFIGKSVPAKTTYCHNGNRYQHNKICSGQTNIVPSCGTHEGTIQSTAED
jgi:hypothetical protein